MPRNHVQAILSRDVNGQTQLLRIYEKLEWPKLTYEDSIEVLQEGGRLEPIMVI